MRLFLFPASLVILLGLFFPLRNEVKPKKNIILGVTLPHEGRTDAWILALCATYQKQLEIATLFVAICTLPMRILRTMGTDGQVFFYFSLWLFLAMSLPYLPYFSAHRKLAAYKREQGWQGAAAGQMVVDLKAAGVAQKNLSPLHFILPTLLCFVPNLVLLARGQTAFYLHSMTLFTAPIIPLIYFFYRFINRQRSDLVDNNASLSAALTQVRRHNWNWMYLYTSWLTALLMVSISLLSGYMIALLAVTLVFLVVTVVLAMRTEMRVRSAQRKLTEEAGQSFYVDDDQFWPLGMFYHNPNDSHVMMNQRTGMNMTVNLGRPMGKLFMTLSVLAILAVPFLAAWMLQTEKAGVTIELTATQVVSHYEVYYYDIVSVTLMEELPEDTVRTMGTGMTHLLQGNFAMPGAEKCKFNLDPTVPPFLRIETEELVYIFGTRDSAETRQLYDRLMQVLA